MAVQWRSVRPMVVPSVVSCIAVAMGCERSGPRTYKVQGKVTYSDGSPMTAGTVDFELVDPIAYKGHPVNAAGGIAPDGTYYLSTEKDGDGAWPGRHRAIVSDMIPDLEFGERWQPTIDPRYRSYEESGLEFEVQAQEVNQIDIQVRRPAR